MHQHHCLAYISFVTKFVIGYYHIVWSILAWIFNLLRISSAVDPLYRCSPGPLYDKRRFRERIRILRRLDCARDFFPPDRFRGDVDDRFASTFFGRGGMRVGGLLT